MDDTDLPRELIEESEEPKPEKLFESLYQRLISMGINDKIRLATLGNKEARNLLIKDPNRLVVNAVLGSPKLTEDEVVSFAANKNLAKEVANLIASKKEYVKNYSIRVALVNNPKTAVPTAVKLLQFLLEKDVRNVAKSKGISNIVVAAARRIITQKQSARQ
jgi:hypothetical protein